VKKVRSLYAELERKNDALVTYTKKARKFPKHGPRRQVLDQLINILHAEIRILEYVIDEKLKLKQHLSAEVIEDNEAWLK
jgi:hypothetical protein